MIADATSWVASTPIAELMRTQAWMYPVVEIIHILGFILLVGGIALFDLRVLGMASRVPVAQLGGHLIPCALAGLALVVPAGLLLFSADPVRLATNPVFQLKLALIGCAGLNALLFHAGPYRQVTKWIAGGAPAPARARAHALLSILLWIAVVSCGRLLAYV